MVYSTGFEQSSGFESGFTLRNQGGWIGEGSGGNGILLQHFEGFGQAAYIGYDSPTVKDISNNVWRPVDLVPVPAGLPIVRFSVYMQIVDSSNGHYDDFRWSVYNRAGHRLFSVDFDNSNLDINYALDSAEGFVPTGYQFQTNGTYQLEITMNFARNLWSASLGGITIVNAVPITTTGAALDLGDIDAVWSIHNAGFAGDNYMVFDDYAITAYPLATMQPRIEQFGIQTDGSYFFRAIGEPGVLYVLEDSVDMVEWLSVATDLAPEDGIIEYSDPDPTGIPHRFFRVRTLEL